MTLDSTIEQHFKRMYVHEPEFLKKINKKPLEIIPTCFDIDEFFVAIDDLMLGVGIFDDRKNVKVRLKVILECRVNSIYTTFCTPVRS